MAIQITVPQLHSILLNTFSADVGLRQSSEENLKQLQPVPGYLPLLLQSLAQPEVDRSVQQAAAITLKNNIKSRWQDHPLHGPSPFSPEDKEVIRANSVEVLVRQADKSLLDLVAESINQIAASDYPTLWPNLVPTLISHIESGEAVRMHNALVAVRKLVKRYEFKPVSPPELRAPLYHLITACFPLLRQIFGTLLANNSLEAAGIHVVILKIFWSSCQFHLPLSVDESVVGLPNWLEMFCELLKKPLPEASEGLEPAGQPIEVAERLKWPHWKVKKWIMQIICRFFSRYGNPNYTAKEVGLDAFAIFYSQQVAPKLLDPVMNTLSLRPSGRFCTDRVVQLALCFLNSAIELSNTYKMIKPHLDFLLFQVVFPALCFKDEDLELFDTDPQEFIRKTNDPMEDYYDPKISAINLMIDLAKSRSKDVLPRLLGFLTEIFNAYAATSPEQRDYRRKDAALLAIGSLDEILKKKKLYSQSLEGLLVNHVFPEFSSPHGFMRCRAFWIIQRFSDIKFIDTNNVTLSIQSTLQGLQDPALPVQIEAASALKFLIMLDGTDSLLLPVLPSILQQYFRIMSTIGNDIVVQALQVIIDKFGESIFPHAVDIVTQLSNSFLQYVAEGDDDDDAALAAAQCIEAVTTVLESVHNHSQLFPQIEPPLLPVLSKVLGAEGEFMEYLENALDVLSYLTYYGEGISPNLWSIFPAIIQAFHGWAYDFISNMAIALDNYISRGTEVFLSGSHDGVSFITMIIELVAKVLAAEERSAEKEMRKASYLFMSIFHNCQGRVDQFVPTMLDILVLRVARPEQQDQSYVILLEVIASAFFYNATLTLQFCEAKGVTESLFSLWFQKIDLFQTGLAKKLCVLGLTAIMTLPAGALPVPVGQHLASIVNKTVQILHDLENTEEEADEEVESDEELLEEDGKDDEEGFASDQDCKNEEDDAYMNTIQGWVDNKQVAAFLAGDYEESDEDDDDYRSPIDDVDELTYFYNTFRLAFERDSKIYQQIQQAMPPEIQGQCQALLTTASERISAPPTNEM